MKKFFYFSIIMISFAFNECLADKQVEPALNGATKGSVVRLSKVR